MISYAVRTDAGRMHPENQDRVAADLDRGTFIVADGMGGLADAAVTAQSVVDELPVRVWEMVGSLRRPDVARVVTGVVAELNERVRHSARSGPGTTGAAIALLLVREGLAMAVHLGDSRIYVARDGGLDRWTEDHIHDGQLTRFVGMTGEVLPGVSVHDLAPGDRILLCTDGLTNSVYDATLGAALARCGDVGAICKRLTDAAARGGAIDDVSMIAVQYGAREVGDDTALDR